MRITWLEALCVLTIAVATPHLHGKNRSAGDPTLPMLAGSKATVIATRAPAPDPALHLTKITRSDEP